MADLLPECLIQRILCFLSLKEATKMSILSKTWLQAVLTLPSLKLVDDYRNGNMKIVDDIMERYRDGKIPIEKFHISDSIFRTEDFRLIGKWLDIALQNGVKDLVFERIHRYQNGVNDLSFARVHSYQLYPLPIFKILAAKSLRELVLSDCDLMHVSLSSGVANCHSLRKLSLINTHLDGNMLQNLFNSCPLRELVLSDCDLMHVSLSSGVANCHSLRKLSLINTHLDGNMLQNLLNSCPFIVTYIQEDCSGLEKIELLNLQKIKSVSIKTRGGPKLLVKIQTSTLEHLSYNGLWEELDVVDCQKNLISLDLSYVRISDGFLQNLSSRSQSLKVLKIKWCRDVPTELDVSNLVSLEYMGYQIPELKTAGESSQLKHSKIALHCYDTLNTAWFFKLRKFLSNSVSWSQISLYFCVCNEINMEDLQLDHAGPTPKVDILNVNIHLLRKECPSFVDALIWSCQPRRLNLSSTVKFITCFWDDLMYMKNSGYFTSRRSTPCHNQLKGIKAFGENNQPLQIRNGKLAMRTLAKRAKVYFLLDW